MKSAFRIGLLTVALAAAFGLATWTVHDHGVANASGAVAGAQVNDPGSGSHDCQDDSGHDDGKGSGVSGWDGHGGKDDDDGHDDGKDDDDGHDDGKDDDDDGHDDGKDDDDGHDDGKDDDDGDDGKGACPTKERPPKGATSTPRPTHTPVHPKPTATHRPNIVGDVDCSGSVNSRDALLVLQIVAGLKNGLPCIKNADVDCDNAIKAYDAAFILQFEAGFLPSLPHCTDKRPGAAALNAR